MGEISSIVRLTASLPALLTLRIWVVQWPQQAPQAGLSNGLLREMLGPFWTTLSKVIIWGPKVLRAHYS